MQEIVKINRSLGDWEKSAVVSLYNPDGVCVGTLENAVQLLDVRLQIAKQKLTGYAIRIQYNIVYKGYIEPYDGMHNINPDGTMASWAHESDFGKTFM